MKLHEYQSKQLFARHGIPVPQGIVVENAAAAREAARALGLPVVIKAQVLVGGRGKAGGVKLAHTLDEAEELADRILSMSIKGLPVRRVLVDSAADIRGEIYLGAVIDRALRRVVLMASSAGGVDIEEVAAKTPEKIVRVAVDPFIGLPEYLARDVAVAIGLPREHWSEFIKIARGLVEAFHAYDASLAEINPLALVAADGHLRLLALDGKMVIDDNALFRHPELAAMRDPDEESEAERKARAADLNYVSLDGDIGCLVNGAGLAMATLDIIQHFGGRPANFLDVAGGAKADKVAAALRILLADPKVKVVLFNIFGGITRCDEVARGIVQAIEEIKPSVPMVARITGTNKEEGDRILASANLITAESAAEAAQKAIALARAAA
ncbi:MAG: ADP-forming succinate--CoA ligase subunit beta [Thermoflexales bacterium]|nr:ADP-forming succinate--CoA ligase subunit beta [Thermoflexales bacterium]MCX7939458.1 ADP-forming succinate--CoA ligase subunit beta [Thermoflexales bacterium]MDW8054843.1 ADP-forming succinate--CoA ligase subunit beta [Anaerolineae bacterium]MDW8293048.1 ADP-forming succinate--CoA ligase subunit beta [Anaerolineae bacterium]